MVDVNDQVPGGDAADNPSPGKTPEARAARLAKLKQARIERVEAAKQAKQERQAKLAQDNLARKAAKDAKAERDAELKRRQQAFENTIAGASAATSEPAGDVQGVFTEGDKKPADKQAQPSGAQAGAQSNATGKRFSDIHLALLDPNNVDPYAAKRYEQVEIDPGNPHAGYVFSLVPTSNHPKYRPAFTVKPDGIYIHKLTPKSAEGNAKQQALFDKEHARTEQQKLEDTIRLAAQMHGGDFKLTSDVPGVALPVEYINEVGRITKRLFEAGQLVDHEGKRLPSVTFNGYTMGQPQAQPQPQSQQQPKSKNPAPAMA